MFIWESEIILPWYNYTFKDFDYVKNIAKDINFISPNDIK